ELRLELVALADVHRLDRVGQAGFLQEQGDLVAVGGGPVVELDHWVPPRRLPVSVGRSGAGSGRRGWAAPLQPRRERLPARSPGVAGHAPACAADAPAAWQPARPAATLRRLFTQRSPP